MANVDALLDLGEDEALPHPPGNKRDSDLFVVHTRDEEGTVEEEEERYSGDEYREEECEGEHGEQLISDTLDEFDPYAETETTEVVETRVDSEGVVHTTVTKTSRIIRSRSHSTEVPDTQCDDLLGELANGTMTTTSGKIPDVVTTNGVISPESNAVDGGGQGSRYPVDTRPTPQVWESNVSVSGENLCSVCQKRVYEMEKVIADEVIYHKTCFKCNHCKRVLSLGNFASISGQLLCKPHFMELFKTKGNYEEGFGMQRHSKRWNKQARPLQSKSEDEAVNKKTPSPSAAAEVDGYRNQAEVFHFNETEDHVDKDQEIAHETRDKEEIHFTEMSSVRTRFEDISHNAPPVFPSSPISPKRMSKWDKPKDTSPPPPNNHPHEEEEEEVVMSPDSTRDLIAKFAQREDYEEVESPPPTSPRWKPVHRITPPRDFLQESIENAQINGTTDHEEDEEEQEVVNPDIVKSSNEYVKADELPEPEKTRSILAKFRSMEDVNAPPLSPTKSIKKPFAVPAEASHSTPNLGAADSVVTNGDDEVEHQPEVIRPDSQEKYMEGEFPEYGLTKNLLARWRTLEQQNEVKALFPVKLKMQKRQSDPACSFHQMEPVEVVRMSATDDEGESEGREEECLPPPCYTRNILAKFQSLEQQAGRKDTQLPKKEYKWTVKEPKMLLRPGSAKSQSSSSTSGDTDHHMDDGSDVDQHDFNDVEEVLEQQDVEEDVESVLPVAHTRNLLEKFRQMEDSSIPPPSPERSNRIQRSAVQQVSARKATMAPPISNGHATNIEADECDDRLSGEYAQDNMAPEAGEFENEPQHNPDVVRGDEPVIEPLPEQGTTRNLLAKFQALQSIY